MVMEQYPGHGGVGTTERRFFKHMVHHRAILTPSRQSSGSPKT